MVLPRLENWSMVNGQLVGIVFDDPRFSDGYIIRTTTVTELDLEKSQAQTQNTLYKLGKPYDGDAEQNTGTVCLKNEPTASV